MTRLEKERVRMGLDPHTPVNQEDLRRTKENIKRGTRPSSLKTERERKRSKQEIRWYQEYMRNKDVSSRIPFRKKVS